jgi:hypothetical protein
MKGEKLRGQHNPLRIAQAAGLSSGWDDLVGMICRRPVRFSERGLGLMITAPAAPAGRQKMFARQNAKLTFLAESDLYTIQVLSEHLRFMEPVLEASRGKAILLGLGLDNQDGHIRVTRGENFHLLGGSHETHEVMQDKCIRFDEKLQARGKHMGELARQEFLDIAAECEMVLATPRPGQP